MRYVRSRADLYQLQKNARLDSSDTVPAEDVQAGR